MQIGAIKNKTGTFSTTAYVGDLLRERPYGALAAYKLNIKPDEPSGE
jgi:hypothetical protein